MFNISTNGESDLEFYVEDIDDDPCFTIDFKGLTEKIGYFEQRCQETHAYLLGSPGSGEEVLHYRFNC